MEAAFESDDLVSTAFVQGAVFARELDRAFIGFCTGIGEEYLVEAAVLGHCLGELQRDVIVVRRARGDQPRGLLS